MHKIFFSYTLRGNDLDIEKLSLVKKQFSLLHNYSVYIDRIDNPIPNEELKMENSIKLDPININSKYQKRVYTELCSSHLVCIINSSEIHNSEWVREEKKATAINKIPVIYIDINELNLFLEAKEVNDIIETRVMHKINKHIIM